MTSISYSPSDTLTSSAFSRVLSALTVTDSTWGTAALRWILALVMLPHGAQKLLGWFGGYGFAGTMGYFTSLGIPTFLGVLAIAAESIGAVALAAGLMTRVAALGMAANLATAAILVHLPNGFFMNWFGNQKGEGIEYFILGITLSILVAVRGGGRWSADRAISQNITESPAHQ
jgi:putative oxidoreductase